VCQAQPGVDPNFVYPVLTDKDFQLFIRLMNGEAIDNPEKFLADNNVDKEQIQIIAIKIGMNSAGKQMGNLDQIAKEMGQSIIFTPEEDKLYEKYENELTVISSK
jgi:hypothetical protein